MKSSWFNIAVLTLALASEMPLAAQPAIGLIKSNEAGQTTLYMTTESARIGEHLFKVSLSKYQNATCCIVIKGSPEVENADHSFSRPDQDDRSLLYSYPITDETGTSSDNDVVVAVSARSITNGANQYLLTASDGKFYKVKFCLSLEGEHIYISNAQSGLTTDHYYVYFGYEIDRSLTSLPRCVD